MITLSVLDQTPIFHGKTATETLRESIALAQAVERFGYRRFWVAEHHSDEATACASPEILIAAIAAYTTQIRVGSGGVMLPHYSALKVAEIFRLLHALFPGRIDLGVGRGPGAVPNVTRALRELAGIPHNNGSIEQEQDDYIRQLRDLQAFMTDSLPANHPHREIRAMPDSLGSPEIWLLGAGIYSPQIAAALGMPFCFAQFFHPVAPAPHCLELYHQHFRPSLTRDKPYASIAVRAICAETEAEALRLATSFWLVTLQAHGKNVRLPQTERKACFPSLEDTEDYCFTEEDLAFMHSKPLLMIAGDPEQVRTRLTALAETYSVEEIIIANACPDLQGRIRSYQLLAEVFHLQQSSAVSLAGYS